MSSKFQQETPVIASFDGRSFEKPLKLGTDFAMDEVAELLPLLGVSFDAPRGDRGLEVIAMDANNIQQPQSTQNGGTPVQFLQNWLPGYVAYITAARKIDELVGIDVMGSWEDEQIVQQFIELGGAAVPYGDTTVVPLADWNATFVTRTVLNFELGLRVGIKEEARAARMNISSGDQKRSAVGMYLEVQRNAVGFYGYNSGNNLTYGFLTDPNLPAYTNVATVGGNTTWAQKTFLQIQGDLLTAFQTLRTQSQDTIEPNTTPTTLAVPTNCVDYLAKTSDYGISVYGWLKQFYPNCRVVSAPQLNSANSGSNVFYLYADRVNDGLSTDGGKTFMQVVPARQQLLSVQKLAKGYEEDYTNATAGVFLKRGYAITRFSGI